MQLIFNFLLSLMLRSKIFSSIFKHQWCYALRSSPQFSAIIDATLSDLRFTFLTSSMLRSKIFSWFFSHTTRIDAMLLDLFMFLPFCHHRCYALRSSLQFQTCLMLRSKIFSSIVQHTWGYVPRSFLQFSNISDATLQDRFFNFLTSLTRSPRSF